MKLYIAANAENSWKYIGKELILIRANWTQTWATVV